MIHRLLNMIGAGRTSLVDDSDVVQRVQVDEGAIAPDGGRRLTDRVPKIGHFGLASVPPIKSELTLLRAGGLRSQTIAIGSNHQPSRLRNLQPGDSALYDVRGARVQLTADGLAIDCAGMPAVIRNFSSCTIMGDLHVTGDVVGRSAGAAVSLNGLRDAYHAHGHTQVKAGTDTSGLTDHDA